MSQKFADYVVYKANGGDALVKSGRTTIYEHPVDQTTFYVCKDTYFVDTAWVYQMSYQNTTDSAQTYTLEYATGPKAPESADLPKSIGIGASYNGLTMTMDTQTKIFSDFETTESVTKTVSLSVPPSSTLTFYQKKYRFRDSMFFVLATSGQELNVGSPDGDGVLTDEREVEIMSEDYLIVGATLSRSATGTMDVPSVVRADVEDGRETRNPKDLPAMAKDVLKQMGLKLDAEPANIPPK
ncbi:hypothetical protein IW262DRAFT_940878 [Armillaria fumosa]|nr:hypothetical protein IW262DRAFT_940878 [Armillaria fumosa]